MKLVRVKTAKHLPTSSNIRNIDIGKIKDGDDERVSMSLLQTKLYFPATSKPIAEMVTTANKMTLRTISYHLQQNKTLLYRLHRINDGHKFEDEVVEVVHVEEQVFMLPIPHHHLLEGIVVQDPILTVLIVRQKQEDWNAIPTDTFLLQGDHRVVAFQILLREEGRHCHHRCIFVIYIRMRKKKQMKFMKFVIFQQVV